MNVSERNYCRKKLYNICDREKVTIPELLEKSIVILSPNMQKQCEKILYETKKYVLGEC